jgi:hypothetical protein
MATNNHLPDYLDDSMSGIRWLGSCSAQFLMAATRLNRIGCKALFDIGPGAPAAGIVLSRGPGSRLQYQSVRQKFFMFPSGLSAAHKTECSAFW